jgi:protein-disulfide isomerase
MSSDESPNVPAKRDRREAVREKAQQVHVKQSRMRVLRRALLGVGGIAVLGGAAAAVTYALTAMGPAPQLEPANASHDGFAVEVIAGVASAEVDASVDGATAAPMDAEAEPAPTTTPTEAPTVDIRVYVDYLAPGAKEFQLANVQQLSKWVDQEAATLTYYPVAMLTSKSNGTKYSLRAASAAACVANHSPDAFFKYNDELLRNQPVIDSDGLSDVELADIAQASGVAAPKIVRECVEGESFAAWARDATDRALESLPDTDGLSLTGTPMILVNGVQYVGALDDPQEFAQFVFASASDAYYRTSTPTPTATPTPTVAP